MAEAVEAEEAVSETALDFSRQTVVCLPDYAAYPCLSSREAESFKPLKATVDRNRNRLT
jgi:hypothetical protein